MVNTIVGVIGGAGVAATNKLQEIIETSFVEKGAYRDCHHPEMIIYQATQVPSRSLYLEGRGESFIDGYIDIARKLKNAGATKVCMCCNTAHYAIEEIEEGSGISFINLIEAVVSKAKSTPKKNIGLIASDGCLKGRVYEKYFSRHYPDANIIYPDSNMQKEVTRGICNVKNSSRFLGNEHPDRSKNIFTNVCNHLYDKGCDLLIIGCTDIRVDFELEGTIDSLEVLAECIINEHKIDLEEGFNKA